MVEASGSSHSTCLPGLHGADGVVGVQASGQAHVDQVDLGVVVDRVDVGRGGKPELVTDLG
jgi:hypothetical protein